MEVQADVTHRLKKSYKGFVIEVTAPAVRTGGFTAHLSIIRETKTHTDDTPIYSGKVFETANEALEAGLTIGRQQIDADFQPVRIIGN
jgi:hypothetical protein